MGKQAHRPVRTCVACRQEAGKADLVRVVRRPDGTVGLDKSGRTPGRGAYVHAETGCLELARKRRAIDRALGAPLPPEVWNSLRPA
jgi:predicted RNA-binding protein YlxR (DUF448 family)